MDEETYIREEGKTLDGEYVAFYSDPESEPSHGVSLHSFGYYISYTTDSEEWSRKLFEALKHAKITDMD